MYSPRIGLHECGNWDRDPDIPFLGIFVSKIRYFVFAVKTILQSKAVPKLFAKMYKF
jgi:hypothetical protein